MIENMKEGIPNLTTDDIIFSIMEESLKRIEPTVQSFEKEGHALISLSLNLSYIEKSDFVRRVTMAK
jgi:hypothetical protein